MIRLAMVMDPIETIKPHKDSSFAMLIAARARGWELHYLTLADLALRDGETWARTRPIAIGADEQWSLGEAENLPLSRMDLVLMRKDPPFDVEYIMATYLLEQAQRAGVMVVNDPRSLRDANEKLFTAWFPQCCAATLVARETAWIRDFLVEHGDIIVKPLNGMGGASVFHLRPGDPNISVILETLTDHEQRFVMAQRFLPEIQQSGDKRILLLDGEPVPYALARFPAAGETRGNLAAGGRGEGVALTERDHWICQQVGPALREKGLRFVGMDVIGDYLTEVNVTSPTCIRELDACFGLDIAAQFLDKLEASLTA